MDVTSLPFNRTLGLNRDDQGVTLAESAANLNHLNTVHASAQFALAEAASGQYLIDTFPGLAEGALAVVRTFAGKFRNAARGGLHSLASASEEERRKFAEALATRHRALLKISVEVTDAAGNVTLNAAFDWFVQTDRGRNSQ